MPVHDASTDDDDVTDGARDHVAGAAPSGVEAPSWAVHLPPGTNKSTVDLSAGGSLPGAFLAAWRANPAGTVLSTWDGRSVSAAELESRTADAARRYAGAGLGPGHRVLLAAAPGVELVVAYVGALRAGLTVVPANPEYSPAELARLVAVARPALAVLDNPSRLSALAQPSGAVLPGVVSPGAVPSGLASPGSCPAVTPDLAGLAGVGRPAHGEPDLDTAALDDIALVIYTSGTTGRPKGVPLSHANLLASAHAVRLAWRWVPDDHLALCLPLFHVHGLGVGLHGTLVAGAQATLLPRFTPALVAESVERGATVLFGVPTMYHALASSPHVAALSGLRLAVSGSAPLTEAVHAAVRAASGQVVLERYGMTEAGMLVSNPYEGERRPGTVGLPLPGVRVRLAPRPGGTAEIEVCGPNVTTGYLTSGGPGTAGGGPGTAGAFTADGWLRTGDLGTFDPDGYLRISGRAKELIITGGYNVYPREVEELLRSHQDVADAAVVGAPSARWGEVIVAFVVPSATARTELVSILEAFVAEHLVAYKRPRQWRVVAAVPRNPLGKVLRHELVP